MNYKTEEAVSPIIGVILMVSITVILAAVVGAFVFGMGSDMKGSHIVGVKVDKINTTAISVMNTGGQDVGDLTALNIVAYNDDGTATTSTVGLNIADETIVIGTFTKYGANRVVVVGKFADNTEQTVVDVMV